VKISRYAPLEHPLAHQFQRPIESPHRRPGSDSARQFGAQHALPDFLGEDYPAVCSLNQCAVTTYPRLVWTNLRFAHPPLRSPFYVCRLLFLRPFWKSRLDGTASDWLI